MGFRKLPLFRRALGRPQLEEDLNRTRLAAIRQRQLEANFTAKGRFGRSLAGDGADEEAHSAPGRRFAAEGVHAMKPEESPDEPRPSTSTRTNGSEGSVEEEWTEEELRAQEEAKAKFSEVYRNKVQALKEEAGSKHHIPISGNLYMFRFLKPFGETSGIIQQKSSIFVDIGLNLVMLVQFFGPMIVFIAALQQVNSNGLGLRNWEFKSDHDGAFARLGQRILGLFFLIIFIMNGMYVIHSDRNETKKLVELNHLFKLQVEEHNTANTDETRADLQAKLDKARARLEASQAKYDRGDPTPFLTRHRDAVEDLEMKLSEAQEFKKPKFAWLWIGAVINCTCFISCACAMFVLFVTGEGPKDVLFDAFGLTFLYNLDDVGGDLAFLDEKWDEDLMGDMYGSLRDIDGALDKIRGWRKKKFTPDNIYKYVEFFMWGMLFVMPLMFIFVNMELAEGGDRRLGEALPDISEATLSQLSVGELLDFVRAAAARKTP